MPQLDLIGLFGGSVEIIAGLLIINKAGKKNPTLGLGAGGAVVLIGLVVLMRAYGLVSGISGWTLIGSALLVFGSTIYGASGRNPRTLLLIVPFIVGVFVIPFVQLYVFYFPTLLLYAYISTWFAVMDSFGLSSIELASILPRVNKYSRTLLFPFALIERIATKGRPTELTRKTLFSGYLAFEIFLLLVVPTLFALVIGGTLAFEGLTFLLIGVVVIAGWPLGKIRPS